MRPVFPGDAERLKRLFDPACQFREDGDGLNAGKQRVWAMRIRKISKARNRNLEGLPEMHISECAFEFAQPRFRPRANEFARDVQIFHAATS